jgi:hypothetical protein
MIGIYFDINIEMAALERIFIVTFGGLHVKHAVQRGI